MGAAGGWIDKNTLARVPKQVYSLRAWLIVIWASYCGGLHGFNTANINGIMSMKSFSSYYHLNHRPASEVANITGWVTSAMLLGQTAGVILSGPVNERFGRKCSIAIAAFFYIIGAILMAANFGSITQLMVARVLSGIGSGFGMATGAVYISEVAPRELRGMMATLYNVNIMGGVAGAYWINYGSTIHIASTSPWQWRVPMILQMIPGLVLAAGLPFCPESPRFLALRGKEETAKKALLRIRGLPEDHEYFREEFQELQLKVSSEAEEAKGFHGLVQLIKLCSTNPSIRSRLFFTLIIQTLFIMSGGNSITYYAPTILKSIGLVNTQILLFTAVYGLIKVSSVFIYAMFLVDRFGRRPLLIAGATINFVCLLYLACYLGLAKITAGTHPSAAAWVAIVAICVFAVGYGFGWAPAFSLATSEICPTRVRGPIVTIAFTYQNLLNFGITRGFPNMTETMHAFGPFALFAAFTFVGVFWLIVAFPECKGRSMEAMDDLFNMPWYKVGRARVPLEMGYGLDRDIEKEKDETIETIESI